jgi:outer membrane protein assembly factor BamB
MVSREEYMMKHLLAFGIIFLFLSSVVAPITFGYNINPSDDQIKNLNFDSYHISEITGYGPINEYEESSDFIRARDIESFIPSFQPLDGPMDSSWPMCSHDVRHTGRSSYSTANNTGFEKWNYPLESGATSGVVIDNDGTIYVGSDGIYAINFNGTLRWKFTTNYRIFVTPAIDENGVIYFGTIYASPDYLHAVYTSNGTVKWKFSMGDHIFSSPAIGDDGTIYIGGYNSYFYALYPNRTLKWKYKTGDNILSSPVIGQDGTIYCGSHDHHLYAFYPDNGTVKWKFKTGHYVRANPCIADDGTIYCVSRDGYLYAVYPNNGTRKWRTNVGAGTSPTIGQDGTIYAGWRDLYAINPINGAIKWIFDLGSDTYIEGSTPCNAIDGTIYFGTHIGEYDGGEIIAVNSDGTYKWRKMIANDWVDSAPAIGEDGTVYIGSSWNLDEDSYIYAFGYPGPNPLKPAISGPSSGKPGTSYTYSFTSIDPDEEQVSYYIDWDDGNITDWTSYQTSGEPYSESHTWTTKDTYTIKAKAKDTDGYESDWGTLTVSIPRDKKMNNMLLLRLLERLPLLREVISWLIPR